MSGDQGKVLSVIFSREGSQTGSGVCQRLSGEIEGVWGLKNFVEVMGFNFEREV